MPVADSRLTSSASSSNADMQATLARSFAASKKALFNDVPLWINGQAVTSKKTFDVKHPISGELVSRVSASEEGDV